MFDTAHQVLAKVTFREHQEAEPVRRGRVPGRDPAAGGVRTGGRVYDRGAFLPAWRQTAPDSWEGLETWVVTFGSEAGEIHQKLVEWVPADQLSQVPAEALRGRYKKVPRIK